MSDKPVDDNDNLVIDTNTERIEEVWIDLTDTEGIGATANNYTSSAAANAEIIVALKENNYTKARSILKGWGPSREQREAMINYYEQGNRTFPPPYDEFIQPASDVGLVIAEYRAKNTKDDRTDNKRRWAVGLLIGGLFAIVVAALQAEVDPTSLQTIIMAGVGIVLMILIFLIATMT